MKKIVRLGGLVVLIFLSFSLARNITRIVGADKRIDSERKKLEKAKEENERIKKLLETLDSHEYFEKVARDKLGLGNSGETIVILPDADTLRKLSLRHKDEEELLPDPNWKKWLKVFF